MKRLRAGIIGLGRIGCLYERDELARKYYPCLTHAGAYKKNSQIELVCGADCDPAKLRSFKELFNVDNLFLDYRRMLEKNRLDILSICTPADTHFEVICQASKSIPVIFCEKPFTRGSEEIKKIISLQNNHSGKISVNLYREYDASFSKIRDLLISGTLGKIQRINCYYGKGLRNSGIHVLGYLTGILGYPEKIEVFNKYKYENIDEFTYDVYFEFKDNIPVFLQSCDYSFYRISEFDFLCEKGRVQILDEGLTMRLYVVKPNRAETGAFELIEKRGAMRSTVGSALCGAVKHLIDLCKNPLKVPIVSPERYLKIQKIVENIENNA